MEVRRNEALGENGLYATAAYGRGSVVFTLSGAETSAPTKYSIHVGDGVHVTDEHGSFMNHSFAPSTAIVGRSVVALRDVAVGDELTFNYNASELAMACPFVADGRLVSGAADDDPAASQTPCK